MAEAARAERAAVKTAARESREAAKAERAAAKQAAREQHRADKQAARAESAPLATEVTAVQQAEAAERDTVIQEADGQVAAVETAREAERAAAVRFAPVAAPTVESVVEAPEAPTERQQRHEARAAKRQEREEAKAKRRAKREEAKAAKIADSVVPAGSDDPMVEPPPTLGDSSDRSASTERPRLMMALLVLGAVGLACSVVLAVGALVAAVEADADGGVVGAVSGVCDFLAGPLNGLFQFSGENAASKTDLITRGVASMVYLAIGLSLPALARRRDS